MHELYIEDIGKSTVDATAKVGKDSGTLGLEDPKSSEILGEINLVESDVSKAICGVSTKTTSVFVQEPNQESVIESAAVPDVTTTEGGQSDDVDNDDDSHQK
ncbi:hypothetical protein A2U01_0068978, partial [Trifolium medium]|nr:hypothetical protein [Trifolium medium]